MENIIFQDNRLILKVGKTSWLIKIILFPTAFLFFLLPTSGLVLSLSEGNGLTFGIVIVLAIFFLLSFYLLRISLWNTLGKEIIDIGKEKITYTADYGWFKDSVKEIPIQNLECTIRLNQSNTEGVLIFESDEERVESVIELPILVLEDVLSQFKNSVPLSNTSD